MLQKEQRAIQEGKDSQQIRGRNNKQPILKAKVTDFITGNVTTVHTQDEIVRAAAELNLPRQSIITLTDFYHCTAASIKK